MLPRYQGITRRRNEYALLRKFVVVILIIWAIVLIILMLYPQAEDKHAGQGVDVRQGGARGQTAEDMHGQTAEDMHGQTAEDMHGKTAEDMHGLAAEDMHGLAAEDMHGRGADMHGKTAEDMHGQTEMNQKAPGKDGKDYRIIQPGTSMLRPGYDEKKRLFGSFCDVGIGRVPIKSPSHRSIEIFDVRVDGIPSKESFFRNYINRSKPVLIKGLVETWPAFQKWKSDQYLLQKAGHEIVHVERSGSNRFGYKAKNWLESNIRLSRFLKLYKQKNQLDEVLYMSSDIPRNLEVDIDLPNFIYCLDWQHTPYYIQFGIWFGFGGMNSLVHNDPHDNLLAIIDGYKRVILFPPSESKNMYEDRQGSARTSSIDIQNPDLVKYPRFKNAQNPYEVILGPGDMLFIPAFWFHQVESSCRSLAANFWFDTRNVENLFTKYYPNEMTKHSSEDLVRRMFGQPSQCDDIEQLKNVNQSFFWE